MGKVMKSSVNEITGDNLVSKSSNQDAYAEGYDRIFRKEKKEEPKKKSVPIVLSNKIQCKKCGDIIESFSGYDFKYCSCESVAVDGGKNPWGMRRIGNPEDYIDLSEVTSEDEDDWFERVRNTFTWKSYGKSGKEQAKEILLKHLEEDHIRAILETQWHIKGTSTEKYMQMELDYRRNQVLNELTEISQELGGYD